MNWSPLWSYHFQNYESLPAVSAGITQIIRFPSVTAAEKIRLLFSNENGQNGVRFRDGTLTAGGSEAVITWGGSTELNLLPGEVRMTDALDLPLKKGETLTIEIKLEGTFTGYAGLNNSTFFQVDFRDCAGKCVMPEEFSAVARKPFNPFVYFGIRSIEVLTKSNLEVITVFGDSLVHQGHWFQEIYQSSWVHNCPNVFLNEGISGNRVLRDANTASSINSIFGAAGMKRLERDVFSRYHPHKVILAEGINDLVHPGAGCPNEELPTSAELIKGLTGLCELVKKHGSLPVLATLSPFYGYDQSWTEQKEQIRQEVNCWIRTQEHLLDIDAYVRSDNRPECLKEAYDSGDHLHFNQLAGKRIAERWLEIQ